MITSERAVRIYPTERQEAAFVRISGCCRLVYNVGLEQRRSFWRQYRRIKGKGISLAGQREEIKDMKAEADFLKEVPAHCLQMALVDLDAAFAKFFAGEAGYPKPRRKFDNDSFTFPDPEQVRIRVSEGVLVLPKFGKTSKDNGPIRAVFHRQITGRPKRITISRDGQHWYASILVAVRLRQRNRPRDISQVTEADVIGLDRGVKVPVATSDGVLLGRRIEDANALRKEARLHKNLSRTQRGSKRRKKALARLRVHKARMTRRRRDMIHQITSTIVKNHNVVLIEKLRVAAMTASAKGTVTAPGRNVAQKAGLNRSILASGWGELRRQLSYKLAWRGGRLIEVAPQNTSRTCPACKTVDEASRVSRDLFCCTACGHTAHADVAAALEIKDRGLKTLGLTPRLEPSGQPVEPSAPSKAESGRKENMISRPITSPVELVT